MVRRRSGGWAVFCGAALFACAARAAETVTVIGTTMLPGTGIDADRLPESIETLEAPDLAREGEPSLAAALGDRLGAVNINDDLDDPFQPDLLYRGFEASPVLGTPEGLAVFQNGVRINEAFGDSVNWDLVPDAAVARVDVVSANPVYGLNALGGAVIVTMKDGFGAPGGELELSGGSFGRREASGQYGASDGRWGFFAAGEIEAIDGWRAFSPDAVARFYGDASWRSAAASLDFSLTAADNRLDGESPAPVQELAVDRALVFTNPQSNRNRLLFPALNARYALDAEIALQANVYYRGFRQASVNGNTTDYVACGGMPGALCQPDGTTPLSDMQGAPIPDLSQGGTKPIGENDFAQIASDGAGATVQFDDAAPLFGLGNHLALGASLDDSATQFRSQAEIGAIEALLRVAPSGYFVSTPEGGAGTATPVSLDARDRNSGAFATDTLDLTPGISVTASGRYNDAEIVLADRRGTALSGRARYGRFNPALGLADVLSRDATVYVGYSGGNRAPTPDEIECSSPAAPCTLPSSLSSDPPVLKQVVSHSWEAGLRGRAMLSSGAAVAWHAGIYRTAVDDDIYGVATSLSSGYFRNVGATRRQGADLALHYEGGRLSGFLSYDLVEATFESAFALPSPYNSGADGAGDIQVRAGDRLPGIPRQRLKAGADYRLTPVWSAGFVVAAESSQYLRGDESNQMKPLGGFATANVHSVYRLGDRVELYLQLFNLFDEKYATFGELGDPTGVGAPGVPAASGADDRFESPAPPRSVFGGVRFFF